MTILTNGSTSERVRVCLFLVLPFALAKVKGVGPTAEWGWMAVLWPVWIGTVLTILLFFLGRFLFYCECLKNKVFNRKSRRGMCSRELETEFPWETNDHVT